MKTSTGVFTFDKSLSYNNSQSFGLGAGYNIRRFLQLNLSFFFGSTQQHISQAASVQTAKYKIYHYSANFRFMSPRPLLSFKPYFTLGLGGILINPEAVTLDLGLGNSMTIEPPIDKRFSGNIGVGFLRQITKRMAVELKAQRYFFNLKDANNDGIPANNNYFGISFIWMF